MKRTKPKVIRTSEAVKINPKDVPAFEFQIAWSVLATSLKRALADPQLRADFDRWKERRAESQSQPDGPKERS